MRKSGRRTGREGASEGGKGEGREAARKGGEEGREERAKGGGTRGKMGGEVEGEKVMERGRWKCVAKGRENKEETWQKEGEKDDREEKGDDKGKGEEGWLGGGGHCEQLAEGLISQLEEKKI